MSLLDLIDTLDQRGAEDAASAEHIHAVRSVLPGLWRRNKGVRCSSRWCGKQHG
jgi:hypothetical protein